MVQDAASMVFTGIAKLSKEYCRINYDTVMQYLKAAMANRNSNVLGRARAIYSISYLGFAVGKEKFRDDAKQVFTTHHWMVRIYKLKPPKNRIRGKTKKSKSKSNSASSKRSATRKKNPWH